MVRLTCLTLRGSQIQILFETVAVRVVASGYLDTVGIVSASFRSTHQTLRRPGKSSSFSSGYSASFSASDHHPLVTAAVEEAVLTSESLVVESPRVAGVVVEESDGEHLEVLVQVEGVQA